MTWTFAILAMLTIAGAVAAMSLRNLVHCALALTIAFAGLAALYLQLGAQFVGFAQVLVYVGAVAILIVFAILLTRGSEPSAQPIVSSSWIVGVAVALLVFGILTAAVAGSAISRTEAPAAAATHVRDLGMRLMTRYVLPLEVIGLLLTVAMIGAVIIAMKEPEKKSGANA